jgi:altronate hydrolase
MIPSSSKRQQLVMEGLSKESHMPALVLKLDPKDNVLIALRDLRQGETVEFSEHSYTLATDVPAKQKFATEDLSVGASITMYGVLVGKAREPIRRGEIITTRNVAHDAAPFRESIGRQKWVGPNAERWRHRTFQGYWRVDGQVGTRNYWLVVPLVFCENRNIDVMKQAFEEELGLAAPDVYRQQVADLVRLYRDGSDLDLKSLPAEPAASAPARRVFENLDGIKFLMHEGGCGGTREDSNNLCSLIAGYIHHPNVAGATVLSLGCQHSQAAILRDEINKLDANFSKPLLTFEQQQSGSDGFSGLSANPAIGHLSDILAALGGRTILSEFPELCGVEQELIDRSGSPEVSGKFIQLMCDYAARAKAVRSGFDMNPSPGNIRDGLITDAMKSAGAARKGGTSPVVAVLDYPEYCTQPGLNLQCTPGNDVECVTAQTGAGANVVLFTTGLGTPTGNPIAPVVKISTNSKLAERMKDIIDIDTGSVISGEKTIEEMGDYILEMVLRVASGEVRTKAEILAQDDFIPWKRGVSL